MKKSILSAILSIVLLSLPLTAGELNPVKKKMSPRKMKQPRKKKRYVFTLGVGLIWEAIPPIRNPQSSV
jgi:hypothetical protein